jgi:hypothetical protein
VAAIASAQAEAASWTFNYSGIDIGNGETITTVGTLTSNDTAPTVTYLGASGVGPDVYGFDIASIAGTRTEGGVTQTITGMYGTAGSVQWVAPGSDPLTLAPGWYFDNIVYDANAPAKFDLRGVEYAALANGVTSLYDVYVQNGTFYENFTPLSNGSVSAVPLPPALPLFGALVVGLGIFGWRQKHLRTPRDSSTILGSLT